MTVSLRPHHLLCLLTYAGKGYTRSFTENFDAITVRLAAGEDIAVIDGPDDICRPWLGEPEAHCERDSVTVRDSQALADLGALLGRPVAALTTLPDLATLRAAFSSGKTRTACRGCEWFGLCSDTAAGGFHGTRIGEAQPKVKE